MTYITQRQRRQIETEMERPKQRDIENNCKKRRIIEYNQKIL